MNVDRGEAERWEDAFDRAWQDPSRGDQMRCPSCGERALKLVYVTIDPAASRGMYAFWCGACLNGLRPGTGPIPQGAVRIRRGEEEVPSYRVVPG